MAQRPFVILSLFLIAWFLVPMGPGRNCLGQTWYVRTPDMQLLLNSPEHSYLAGHLTRCFENSLRFHRSLFGYTPSEEITTSLEDYNDYGNAGATAIPWNHLYIGLEPNNYVYETSPTNERMNWVMNHELAHIVATDKAAGADNFFRSVFFGKVVPTNEDPVSMLYGYLTTPRWYSPRWYHEGLAVFFETWMSGGIGRVLGGYDEMVFRTMVNDSSYFYDFVGIESEGKTTDFQIGAVSYLYGTRFMSYLAYRYGPEKLVQWFNRTPGSDAYFGSQFERVFGVSLDDEWSRWIAWEHEWQQANLDSVRRYPTTPYRKITGTALGSVSRTYFDSTRHCLYAAVNLPGQLAGIVSIDLGSGRIDRICNVASPALYDVCSLAFDPAGDQIFFTTHNSRYWRSLNRVDLKTRKTELLIPDQRIGDLVINARDSSVWGVQHHNGYSTIVRIRSPYRDYDRVVRLDYGKDLFDLDFSPDGSSLTGSFIEITGRQTLVRFQTGRLLSGEATPEVILEFDNNNSPYNFVHTPDGKSVIGTSYYSGISNVYRVDLATGKLDALTNAETGIFRPLPVSSDSMVAFRYTGGGFLPVMLAIRECKDVSAIRYLGNEIAEKYPLVRSWTLGSPMAINIDSVMTSTGVYHGLEHLRLASAYPVVEGYKNTVTFGEHISIRDPGEEQFFDLIASYSPNRSLEPDERAHFNGTYFAGWVKATAAYNGSDFYDLFGPTKTSRKGYSASVSYANILLFDPPRTMRYSLGIAGYGGLERLPEFQNVSAPYDRFLTHSARLEYSDISRSLGAVDEEEGRRWSLNLSSTLVNRRYFPRLSGTLDLGFLLPLDHSPVWLRSSAGWSPGDPDESFANFYFGGFGNNWVDHLAEDRYRESYSFPGTELNSISGTNFVREMLEWDLPPIRFRRFGIPTMYSNWMRVALFSSALFTNMGGADQFTGFDLGVQLDIKTILFSSLESTLSLGYALAGETSGRPSREAMASLKILR